MPAELARQLCWPDSLRPALRLERKARQCKGTSEIRRKQIRLGEKAFRPEGRRQPGKPPPTNDDFLSYREMGKKVSRKKECDACGLSVFRSKEEAVHHRSVCLLATLVTKSRQGRLIPALRQNGRDADRKIPIACFLVALCVRGPCNDLQSGRGAFLEMWHVNGKPISGAWLNLEPVRVLYDFDGPRIFTCKDVNGTLFLAYQCGEDRETMRFLIVPFQR